MYVYENTLLTSYIQCVQHHMHCTALNVKFIITAQRPLVHMFPNSRNTNNNIDIRIHKNRLKINSESEHLFEE